MILRVRFSMEDVWTLDLHNNLLFFFFFFLLVLIVNGGIVMHLSLLSDSYHPEKWRNYLSTESHTRSVCAEFPKKHHAITVQYKTMFGNLTSFPISTKKKSKCVKIQNVSRRKRDTTSVSVIAVKGLCWLCWNVINEFLKWRASLSWVVENTNPDSPGVDTNPTVQTL